DNLGYHYKYVDVEFDRPGRTATLTVQGPEGLQPMESEAIHREGDQWWPLRMARELDDAILMLRVNEPELGLLLLKTAGSIDAVLASDEVMLEHRSDWLGRETIGMLRRTFARLDVSSRSMYALIDPGSCFAGILYELVVAADRSYMLSMEEEDGDAPKIAVNVFNFGLLPAVNNLSRLEMRCSGRARTRAAILERMGRAMSTGDALELGLVTFAPDELDWQDEVRIAIEE